MTLHPYALFALYENKEVLLKNNELYDKDGNRLSKNKWQQAHIIYMEMEAQLKADHEAKLQEYKIKLQTVFDNELAQLILDSLKFPQPKLVFVTSVNRHNVCRILDDTFRERLSKL